MFVPSPLALDSTNNGLRLLLFSEKLRLKDVGNNRRISPDSIFSFFFWRPTSS